MPRPRLAAPVLALILGGLLLIPAAPIRADDAPEAVLELLKSSKWEDRVKGLEALAVRKDDRKAAERAADLLGDEDWEVGITAARTLGKIGTKVAEDALVKAAIEGRIAWLREAAVEGLKTFAGEALGERILKRIKAYKKPREKIHLLRVFGAVAPGSLVDKLRTLTRHKDIHVAAAAVRAIADIVARDETAYEVSLKLLEHPLDNRKARKHFYAYAAAIDALGAMDHPQARLRLMRELFLLPDEDPYIPRRIAYLAATMDPLRVKSALGDAVRDAKEDVHQRRLARFVADTHLVAYGDRLIRTHLKHKDETVVSEAVRALGLLGKPDYAAPIRRVLEQHDSWRGRREAVTALARLLEPKAFRELEPAIRMDTSIEVRRQYVVEINDQGDPEGIPVLASFVGDKEWLVSTAAIAAIGTLGIDGDLPLLTPLVKHKQWKVRATAYEAMGRLRAAKAIPALTEGLTDKDPVVRGVCLANLQILTREKLGEDPKVWREWWRKKGEDLVLQKRSRMTKQEKEQEEVEREKTRYAHERYKFDRKRGVEILQKARIIVVEGAWDHVERVLHHLEIPHTSLRAQELKSVGLNPNQVVLVNCEGNVDKDAADRLRWFVNVGGYVMSTDWALTKAVRVCFPGYAQQFSGSTTGNDVVAVERTPPGHPFTRGIFEGVPALMWWLEIQAFPITVTYPERCEVIVDSATMKQRYGSSPMAVVFRWGLGKVQHSVSHFYLQEEGMQKARNSEERAVFAADNLGLSLAQIRKLKATGGFKGKLNEETMKEIAPDYSMFRLIVNVVKEKEDWVESL